MSELTLSIVIPTYYRERVLIETVQYLLDFAEITKGFTELIIVDQTPQHEPDTEHQLSVWNDRRAIIWLRPDEPHITRSMNLGLIKARGDIVLFTDDDIIPNGNLIEGHLTAHHEFPEADAIVGQVLQPGQSPEDVSIKPSGDKLRRYLDFPFKGTRGAWIENAMAGNLSVRRTRAIELGGFDENFIPPVASRFETEFAKRLIDQGGRIRFDPRASIQHLQVSSGGTRSKGSHLSSASPRYGVGDYYYAFRHGKGWGLWAYVLRRPFREVCTRFHLRHPWYIPVKFIGEIRAFIAGWWLSCQKPIYVKASANNP